MVRASDARGRFQPTDVAIGAAPAPTTGGWPAGSQVASPILTPGGPLAPSLDTRAALPTGGAPCGDGSEVGRGTVADPLSADSEERADEKQCQHRCSQAANDSVQDNRSQSDGASCGKGQQ